MKFKILMCGMLVLMVLLSGCGRGNYDKECLEGIAEKLCEEKNCIVNSVDSGGTLLGSILPVMYVYVGEFRESLSIRFTEKEKKSCGVES